MASAAAFLPQAEFSVLCGYKVLCILIFFIFKRRVAKYRSWTDRCLSGTCGHALLCGGRRWRKNAKQATLYGKAEKVAKLAVMDAVLNRPISIYGFADEGILSSLSDVPGYAFDSC